MCNRSAEWCPGRFLRVHVDELEVIGRLGELVDPFLGNLKPRGGLQFPTDQCWQVFGFNSFVHSLALWSTLAFGLILLWGDAVSPSGNMLSYPVAATCHLRDAGFTIAGRPDAAPG